MASSSSLPSTSVTTKSVSPNDGKAASVRRGSGGAPAIGSPPLPQLIRASSCDVPAAVTIINGIAYPSDMNGTGIGISVDVGGYNAWLNHRDWILTADGRTAHTTGNWKTLRTVAGYCSGRHIIDFTSSAHFKWSYIGFVSPSYTSWSNNSVMGERNNGGVALDRSTGAFVGRNDLPRLGQFNFGDVTCVRFVLDFTAFLIEVWYDDERKGVFTFDQLRLPTNTTIYAATSLGMNSGALTITAPLDGSHTPPRPRPLDVIPMILYNAPTGSARTFVRNGVVYPVGSDAKTSTTYNTWCTPNGVTRNQVWDTTNSGRTTTRIDIHGNRTLRATCGYIGGRHIIDYLLTPGHVYSIYLGLVPASYTAWNDIMGGSDGGCRLNSVDGEVRGVTTMPTKLGAFGTVTHIRFIIDWMIPSSQSQQQQPQPQVEIWYGATQKVVWSFAQLGLPTNEAIYPAIAVNRNCLSPVTLAASLPKMSEQDMITLLAASTPIPLLAPSVSVSVAAMTPLPLLSTPPPPTTTRVPSIDVFALPFPPSLPSLSSSSNVGMVTTSLTETKMTETKGIVVAATVTAAPTLPGHGWSSKIGDYELVERLGMIHLIHPCTINYALLTCLRGP
jgi:hypothetical protein